MRKKWSTILLNEFHSFQKVLYWYEKLGCNFYYYYLTIREFVTRKPSFAHFVYETNTQCTLKCKECHSYMPYFKSHYMADFETFKKEMDKLLKSVDLILSFRFQGGETLLVKDLAKMVEYACSKKQIQHIQIISNGTVIPSKELLNAMKPPKVLFCLSDYSDNATVKPLCKHEKIIDLCKQENINIKHDKSFGGDFWFAKPEIKNSNSYNKENAIKNLKACWCNGMPKSFILFHSKIYICPSSVYFCNEIPNFSTPNDEIIDIMEDDSNLLSKKLRKFIYKKVYYLCSNCNTFENKDKRNIPGEQLIYQTLKVAE